MLLDSTSQNIVRRNILHYFTQELADFRLQFRGVLAIFTSEAQRIRGCQESCHSYPKD